MMMVPSCDPLLLRSMYQRDEGSFEMICISNFMQNVQIKCLAYRNKMASFQIPKIVMEKVALETWAELLSDRPDIVAKPNEVICVLMQPLKPAIWAALIWWVNLNMISFYGQTLAIHAIDFGSISPLIMLN